MNLLSTMDLEQQGEMLKLLRKVKKALKSLPEGETNEQAHEVFADLVDPLLKSGFCC